MLYRRPAYDVCGAQPQRHAVLRATQSPALAVFSSNPVERSNNLVTARRQKHNGMSWSKAGSHALTALNAVVLNGGVQQWVRQREIAFEFAVKAA
jgi:hypothetical protein